MVNRSVFYVRNALITGIVSLTLCGTDVSNKKIAVAEPRGWLDDGDLGKGETVSQIVQSQLNVLMRISLQFQPVNFPHGVSWWDFSAVVAGQTGLPGIILPQSKFFQPVKPFPFLRSLLRRRSRASELSGGLFRKSNRLD